MQLDSRHVTICEGEGRCLYCRRMSTKPSQLINSRDGSHAVEMLGVGAQPAICEISSRLFLPRLGTTQ